MKLLDFTSTTFTTFTKRKARPRTRLPRGAASPLAGRHARVGRVVHRVAQALAVCGHDGVRVLVHGVHDVAARRAEGLPEVRAACRP
jgi:hypothetical protein